MVRTRVAPSPTGYPHVGFIYQVLFDYAYARKYQGQFILRLEDTDRNRLVEDSEETFYKALEWFGLEEDESPRKGGTYGPYRQSERLTLYKQYALELITKGHAYYCFCSKERLGEVRKHLQAAGKVPMYDKHCRFFTKEEVDAKLAAKTPYVIRMKVPENQQIVVRDEMRGEIIFESGGIDDQVLLKADGFPTYHLGVVVDDHTMAITHMLRGEEWLPSSPKHFLLYEFFGWEKPLFFHSAVMRNPDKSKLSKRHGHTSISWYQEQGYLPEALLNFLAIMGWSHPEGKELFSMEEFIKVFEMEDLRVMGPIFDLKKLDWMNGEYIRNMDNAQLAKRIFDFYKGEYAQDIIDKTIPLVKERIKKLSEYLPMCGFLFKAPTEYEVDLSSKKELLQKVHESLVTLDDWKAQRIGEQMLATAQKRGVKNSEFFMVLRIAITGRKISPPLNESMELLGKDECLKRLLQANH